MPTIHWLGKDKVINHQMDVPYRILKHNYGFVDGKQIKNENNSGNRIIYGDNLEALKALLPEYQGKIKCINIDPPYNTGNVGWVYNDNVNDPRIKKWLGKVVGKEAEDLSRHDKWLCMMHPRLKLLHKLLAKEGAIFISIDDNEQANLKFILVEMEEYANDIVAQRVKRVIKGYGVNGKKVEGTGGSFDYYELGKPLFLENDMLNEEVGLEKIREYVWFSETRMPYEAVNNKEPHLLGVANSSAYYFYYYKDRLTTLDDSFLRSVRTPAEQYVIYADNCILDNSLMQKYHITFKKIPRDITRF